MEKTEVMLRPITEFLNIKKMKSCYFIGEDVETLRAFKTQLVDKYSGGDAKTLLFRSTDGSEFSACLGWKFCDYFTHVPLMRC